jgi:hypothetical protein
MPILRGRKSTLSVSLILSMPASCETDTDVKTRFSSRSTQQQAVQTLLTWVAASSTTTCVVAAGGSLRSIPSSRCKRLSAGGIAAREFQLLARACYATRIMRAGAARTTAVAHKQSWWSQTGSNRRPPACKAGALPTELWPRRARRIRSDGNQKPEVKNQRSISGF